MNNTELIMEVTARHCRATGIASKNRKRENVVARQIVYKIMRDYLHYKLVDIGRMFQKDHTTILYSLTTINNLLMAKDPMVVSYYQNVITDSRLENIIKQDRVVMLVVPPEYDQSEIESYLLEKYPEIKTA
jgi:hypothetical protein